MSHQTTPHLSQSPDLQDHSQPRHSFFANVRASRKLVRFWWTVLGVCGVLLGFSLAWVGSLNGSFGWVVALGPWSYDALHFPGLPPVLFLTLWLVPLTTVLLLGTNIVSRGGRPIFWARIWSWFCIGLSLVVLVTVAVATQGSFQFFPFLVMGVSLAVAGLGLFARYPDKWVEIVVIQPRISRRSLLSNLAGMAGLVAISGGVEAWLVGQFQRVGTSRIAYTLPGATNNDSLYSYAFAWTPQNAFVMAQYQDAQNNPLDIWEIAPTTRHLGTAGPEFFYNGAAFAPNGRWLVVTCSNELYQTTSFIWDLQTGASIPTTFGSPRISWSPDSSRLVGRDSNTISGLVIWDVAHNRQLALYQVPETDGIPSRVAWSPNGQWIVVQELPKVTTVRLYEVQTGRLVWTRTVGPHYQTLDGTGVHIASLAWSPDSRYLALPLTGSVFIDDPVTMYPVIIWDVVAQREVFSYTRHLGGANAVAWSPDGQYVASGGTSDATVQVWHAQTGNVVFTFRGHQESVSDQEPILYVGWSPDGATIASADAHKVLVWDAPTR